MKRPIERWSPDQLKTLRRLYPNTPIVDICDQTGHTTQAVVKKVKLLGLQRASDYNPYAFYGRYVKKGSYSQPRKGVNND